MAFFGLKPEASYLDILKLAGHDGKTLITVTYFLDKGLDVTRSGTLTPGQVVQVEEGMRFDAIYTGDA